MPSVPTSNWYVFLDGHQIGPIPDSELLKLVKTGRIRADDYLWCSELLVWTKLNSIDSKLFSKNRSVLSRLFRASYRYSLFEFSSFARAAWRVLTSPSNFASEQISDESDHRLSAAIKFYGGMFSISFLLAWTVTSRFQLYEGISELRSLVLLLIQVLIGTPVVFILLVITRQRTKFFGLLQTILYVDGVYIVLASTLHLLIQFLESQISIPIAKSAVDIFGTELEKCLSSESAVYWAIRGDLQFYLYYDVWRPGNWGRQIAENQSYILAIPFIVIFALMIRAKYGGNILLLSVIAGVGFTVAIGTTVYAASTIVSRLQAASTCHDRFLDEITRKYSVSLIAQQLEYKINNDTRKALADPVGAPLFVLRGEEYVFSGKLKHKQDTDWPKFTSRADTAFKSIFCAGGVYWELVRRMNFKLIVLFQDFDSESIVYWKRFVRRDCEAADGKRHSE